MTTIEAQIDLTAEEQLELALLIDSLPVFDLRRLENAFLDRLHDWTELVPSRLTDAVGDLVGGKLPSGGLLVRNLPCDPGLPATPADGMPAHDKETRVSEYVLLLLSSVAGEALGYEEEKEGLLVHDVCPRRGSEERQENTGSVFFDVHTENAFHPLCPDLLSLTCLRADRDGKARTLIAPVLKALGMVPAAQRDVLRRPLFETRMPSSFAYEGRSAHKPIIFGPDDDPRVCVDSFNTIPLTDEADESFRRLIEVLHEGLDGPLLEPGDLLLVDNRRAVHGRTAFTPRYDGEDRWLQRVYVVCEPRKVEWVRSAGTHVCSGLVGSEAVAA